LDEEGRVSARPAAILIAGPTASGKSALAVEVAKRIGGAVVNADSMQVYADLSILSARPTEAEQERVPHLLFGHVDGAVNYSVGRWLEDARRVAAELTAAGLVPVFTGGTGMYFMALTRGLSEIPAVPDAVRARVRAEAEGLEASALHERLAQVDPIMAARLRPTDPQRLLRALEVFRATGQSLAHFQGARTAPVFDPAACVSLFLSVDRTDLYARIDSRFETMISAGAVEEVRRLAARGLSPTLPVMRAHGVPGLLDHLAGRITLAEAVRRGQADTRHYARRQHTFARHQLPDFVVTRLEVARPLIAAACDKFNAVAQKPSSP
jgi:tRNA dimethylallyltransferase